MTNSFCCLYLCFLYQSLYHHLLLKCLTLAPTTYMYVLVYSLLHICDSMTGHWTTSPHCLQVVASGHKEHEEPLAVSIPSHHWMENYICPFTVVNYTCTITSGTAAGYTDWTLPTGTCPTNAFPDKIRLSQLFLKLWVFTVHWVQSSGQD